MCLVENKIKNKNWCWQYYPCYRDGKLCTQKWKFHRRLERNDNRRRQLCIRRRDSLRHYRRNRSQRLRFIRPRCRRQGIYIYIYTPSIYIYFDYLVAVWWWCIYIYRVFCVSVVFLVIPWFAFCKHYGQFAKEQFNSSQKNSLKKREENASIFVLFFYFF